MEIVYRENALTAWQVQQFQQKMGWTVDPLDQWQRATQNPCCTVAAYDGGELVAMGRLLGDGALYWYLNDIFVLTAYQGQGIGRQVVTRLLEHIQREGLPGTEVSVALFSAQGKEGFYEKMGFQKRPGPEAGHGMEQTLRIG